MILICYADEDVEWRRYCPLLETAPGSVELRRWYCGQ